MPEGGMAMPRLLPLVPVEKTVVSSMSGMVMFLVVSGMKMRSCDRRVDCGMKMALPWRLRSVVICLSASRLPCIWASDMFWGMVFSVIMKKVKMPMRRVVNPILMERSFGLRRKMMPIMMRVVPMIFARIWGCSRSVVRFTCVSPLQQMFCVRVGG